MTFDKDLIYNSCQKLSYEVDSKGKMSRWKMAYNISSKKIYIAGVLCIDRGFPTNFTETAEKVAVYTWL